MKQIISNGGSTAASTAMAAGLARLWVKFLPDIEQRLGVLESAAVALAGSALAEDLREQAHAAAHKLAGTLGTFGLHRGTELARLSELLLVKGISTADAGKLSSWLQELNQLVNARQAGV